MHPKEKILVALKKAKSSMGKILTLVEKENPDCFSVIQQNLAIIGLLKSANLLMLENHMERMSERFSGRQATQLKTLHKELLKIVQVAQNK